MNNQKKITSSFRDPSGFLFYRDTQLLRQINKSYKDNYDFFISSGLYEKLKNEKLIISHEELKDKETLSEEAYKLIAPELIPFISYPYEWSFSQLKDAALLTLKIQKIAMDHGLSLKDASAYNVQFYQGQPVFIDTLSFEKNALNKPWVAYRQFCQHFLAPLALMKYKDLRLNQLFRLFIDGVPLDIASKLLPLSSRFKLSILTHVHLHAGSQKHYADKAIKAADRKISTHALYALIDSLEGSIKSLGISRQETEWEKYYSFTNYSETSFEYKKETVLAYIEKVKPTSVWDLGGNTGVFSRLASNQNIFTVSSDIDMLAVDKNYQTVKSEKEKNILPLFIDLSNPSPDLGWANQERESLIKRGPADLVMALALVHHLAISNNLPLENIAEFLTKIGKNIIIEFVPKNDSQVQKLLASREDIFTNYNQENFENVFQKYFNIIEKRQLKDSSRLLYLMAKK